MTEWTEEREAEVRARCADATPGPWHHGTSAVDRDVRTGLSSHNIYGNGHEDITTPGASIDPPDAQFIAHARTDLPDALEEIARLRVELAKRLEEMQYASDLLAISASEIRDLKAQLEYLTEPGDTSS